MQWEPLPGIPGTVGLGQARGMQRLVLRGYARAATHAAVHPVVLFLAAVVVLRGFLEDRGAVTSVLAALATWAVMVAILFAVPLAFGLWATRTAADEAPRSRVYVTVDATAALCVVQHKRRPRLVATHHWGGPRDAGKELRRLVAPKLDSYLRRHNAVLTLQTITPKLTNRYAQDLPRMRGRLGRYTYEPPPVQRS